MGIRDSLKNAAVNAANPGAQPAPAPEMGGPEFAPIAGIPLDTYAALLALMSDVGEDEARCLPIAAERGFPRHAWESAKAGWTARMEDPSLENRVSHAFLHFYGLAMHRKRGGRVPMELERYTRIFAETSFRKDPVDASRPIDRDVVLAEHGLTAQQWNEVLVYWSPKVSDPNDPASKIFSRLIQEESTRLLAGQ